MTRFTIVAIVALITATAQAQGLVPYDGPDVKCITAGRPTLAMYRPACHPTSLLPNARAVRHVRATLRRPLRWHHSNRFRPSHRLR